MQLIIVTEIWGRTRHVDALGKALGPVCGNVLLVDPYDGKNPCFGSERQAYAAFTERCGHLEYARRVEQALPADEKVFLLGFSAGAGAVWSALGCSNAANIGGAMCFYGSSIRNMVDEAARSVFSCQVELIFPEYEPHFDVQALISKLRAYSGVTCQTVPFGHGFMNPLSQNYDERGCNSWIKRVSERLERVAVAP